jgi:hypothetical protein
MVKTFNYKKCIKEIERLIKFDTGSRNDDMINSGLMLSLRIIKENIKEVEHNDDPIPIPVISKKDIKLWKFK